MNKILVLGSTGNVGKLLVARLRAAGETVVAASRSGAVPFDYSLPSTYAAALEGVDRVFLVLPPGVVAADSLMRPFIEAAAGRKLVLQSADGVQFSEEAPLRKVERLIEATGSPYVFLRPNWFMDNFHTFWLAPIRQAGVIPVPAADSRSAFIDADDIAAVAATVLRTADFNGQALSLSGPESLTYTEAAAILSEAAGRPIRYQNVSDADFTQSLIAAGLPQDYAGFMTALYGFVRQGVASPVTGEVERLLGRPPRTLAEYAHDHASAWQ